MALALEHPPTISPAKSEEKPVPEGLPPKIIHLGYNNVYLANGLQPLGTQIIQVGEVSHEVSLLAVAKIRDRHSQETRELWFTQDTFGPEAPSPKELPITVHRVERQGDTVVSQNSITYEAGQPFRFKGKEVRYTLNYEPANPKRRGWATITGSGDVQVAVSEASHPKSINPGVQSEIDRRWRRRKKIGVVLAALALAKGVISPGGIYDRIADSSHSAKEYVIDQFGTMEEAISAIPKKGKTLDGVHLSQQQLIESLKDNETNYYAAVERVASVMEALDSHDYEAISKMAEKYHAQPAWSSKEISEARSKLAKAPTTKQALGVVDKFLKKIGGRATVSWELDPYAEKAHWDLDPKKFHSHSFRDKVKYTGDELIEVLAKLPEPIVRSSIGTPEGWSIDEFSPPGIEFAFGSGDRPSSNHLGYGSAVAVYDGGQIELYHSGRIDLKLKKISIADLKDTLRHEIAHGLFGEDALKKANGHDNLWNRALNVLSHIVNRPNYVTDYATASQEEEAAEVGVQVLAGRITHPDHVRNFESRANRSQLEALIHLESQGNPYITAYLLNSFKPELFKTHRK